MLLISEISKRYTNNRCVDSSTLPASIHFESDRLSQNICHMCAQGIYIFMRRSYRWSTLLDDIYPMFCGIHFKKKSENITFVSLFNSMNSASSTMQQSVDSSFSRRLFSSDLLICLFDAISCSTFTLCTSISFNQQVKWQVTSQRTGDMIGYTQPTGNTRSCDELHLNNCQMSAPKSINIFKSNPFTRKRLTVLNREQNLR